MGEWVHEDDTQLAALMNYTATELKKELGPELLASLKKDGALKKYHRLDDRDPEMILKRTDVISRLSSVLQTVTFNTCRPFLHCLAVPIHCLFRCHPTLVPPGDADGRPCRDFGRRDWRDPQATDAGQRTRVISFVGFLAAL